MDCDSAAVEDYRKKLSPENDNDSNCRNVRVYLPKTQGGC